MDSTLRGRWSRYRAWLALPLSFSIYLIPLVGPHAAWLLGESLSRSATRGEREPAWLGAEIGVALGMQVIAGAIWYWILRRPRSLRPLVLVVVVPVFVVTANWLYMLVLPTRFMIERDTSPERRPWPVACSVPDESLAVTGRKPAVVRSAGDELHVQNSTGRVARAVITAAGATTGATGDDGRVRCDVMTLELPRSDANFAPMWLGPEGRALMNRIDKQTGALSWEWIAGRGASPTPLEAPPGRRVNDPPPVPSRDGSALAWLVPVPDSGQPPAFAIVVAPAGSPADPKPSRQAADVRVALDAVGRGSFVVLDVDTQAREVLLAVDERRFVAVGFDGAVRWGPVRPDGVEPLSMTFRRVGDGWVAWDGYKERDGYVIAWKLPAGAGTHRVPRGRGVTDVAVHPEGRLIAISTTTTLSIGDVRDAVVVIRTSDGAEVFRRTLPRYARSVTAFPSRDLFAYTEWDGARAAVNVLRLPTPAAGG